MTRVPALEAPARLPPLPPLPQVPPSAALGRAFELPAPNAAPLPQSAQRSAGHARQGFRLGTLNLMIRYDQGSELAELPALHRLPHAPDWFRGMANLHGTLLPVFDLAGYLGVAHDDAARPMLLVLDHGADAAGIVIDGLPQRLRVDDADAVDESIVPPALAGCVERACLVAERPWFDLDTRALLARLEAELAR